MIIASSRALSFLLVLIIGVIPFIIAAIIQKKWIVEECTKSHVSGGVWW